MRWFGTNDLDLIEQLFDPIPNTPIFIKNRDLCYVAANRAMADLCGVADPAALYGRRASEFFPAGLVRRYEQLDRQVLASGRPLTDVLDRSAQAGREAAWLLFSRLPVFDRSGICIGIAATARRLRGGAARDSIYERLQRVIGHIHAEFASPLTLTTMAGIAGSSRSGVERDFRAVLGVTPQQFVQRVRHQAACRSLEESGRSIAAIAQECGYADHSAFTRRFRERMGCTPTEYRRSKQQSDDQS